ncbi:MAG: hypothetical protein F6K62_25945, partial [Sphaerospermopsis sp. SIO1G2]|nr:hypothetical protein [Sphaerospermopsis sp. SIO1G2]
LGLPCELGRDKRRVLGSIVLYRRRLPSPYDHPTKSNRIRKRIVRIDKQPAVLPVKRSHVFHRRVATRSARFMLFLQKSEMLRIDG